MRLAKQEPIDYVRAYLKEAQVMHLATTSGDRPWIATCWYACDRSLNLYFISKQTRRHSNELQQNPNVACAIVKPHPTTGAKQPGLQGLQIEGVADELSGTELVHACYYYFSRWARFTKHVTLNSLQDKGSDIRMYRVRPTRIVWLDEINFPDEPHREIVMPEALTSTVR